MGGDGPVSPEQREATTPVLLWFVHYAHESLPLEPLRHQANAALPLCLGRPGSETAVLPQLQEIEINLVDDRTIAEVHGEFLDDPDPTDVITFHHGEIFVSVETAARAAAEHGLPLENELLRYVVHGLLHLNGHTDGDPDCRVAMHRIQEEIVTTVSAPD